MKPSAVLLLVLAATAAPVSATTIRSKAILSGNDAGWQTVEVTTDGLRVQFEFNDRGRGPKLDATYRLDGGGLPVEIAIDGNEYMKGAVSERFAFAAGWASWKSRGEAGKRALEVPGFYLAFDGTPEEAALLAAAALDAPGGRLALLPAGEARAELIETRQVSDSKSGAIEIRHVELAGLGFSPVPIWIDGDGRLFASVSPWFSLIRERFEAELPNLQKSQDARSQAHYRRLAQTLARQPQGELVIRHARLFDAEAGAIRDGWSVRVRGQRIVAVGPDAELVAPAGAEVIDATGQTLLPGLWDMHTHLGEGDGLLHLAAGVTGVRDLANDIDAVSELRRQWDAGETLGPRAVLAGFLDGPGPFAGPTKALAATFDEAKPWLDRYADLGYRQVKLYSSLDTKLVAPIAAYAHERGMRVSGHIPAFMTAEQAVRSGYDEIQHVNMLFLNFLFDEVQDTRTPARFTAVAERGADLDLASSAVTAFLALLRERDIVLDPTLSIFENMFTARAGEISPDFAAVADRLPALVRRGLLGGGLPLVSEKGGRYRASFEKTKAMVLAAWQRGIRIVPGTDSMAGFALHRELELYAEAGIPNLDVLQLATLGAARVAGRDQDNGSIRAGKLADLILVDGAPDLDMSAVRRVRTVVRGGLVLDSDALYAAQGIAPLAGR